MRPKNMSDDERQRLISEPSNYQLWVIDKLTGIERRVTGIETKSRVIGSIYGSLFGVVAAILVAMIK